MEGKKISFGFKKRKNAEKPITINEEEKREYIECVEEKSIKVVGGDTVKNEDPLIIPMKPNTLVTVERLREIGEQVEGDIDDFNIKNEPAVIDEVPENETLDQMAVRELMQEAQKEVTVEEGSLAIPTPAKPVIEGEKESTLDDYEAVPVQQFGLAMLRGMGWTPNKDGMESRSRAVPKQFEAILEYMERHGDLGKQGQQGPRARIRTDSLWQELANKLNSIDGGVVKTVDKWKKVWADWKTKTKKKALIMRRKGSVFISSGRLKTPEERLLCLMGLTAVISKVQAKNKDKGFDESSQRISLPSPTNNSASSELLSQFSEAAEMEIDFRIDEPTPPSPQPSNVLVLPPTQVSLPTTDQVSKPSDPMSTQKPSSPKESISQGEKRRRQRSETPPLVTSPTSPQRRPKLRERTRRTQTPFARATSEFVAVENRRLDLEEDRERNHHQREMERLRLESMRLEMEENRNETLNRLAGILENLTQILPQLRQS